jgi:DNA-directed RNA polymerase specialized sigma24 family protein
MSDNPKLIAARRAVKAAQKQFDRESAAANKLRRKAFTRAQKEGLTLREIAEEVGLHHTRISQIIRGEYSKFGEFDSPKC